MSPTRLNISATTSALLQVSKARAPLGVALEGKTLWSVVDAAALAWKAQGVAARGGSLDESFRQHLFERPFGARFYGGFVASSGELPVAPAAEADLSP